MNNNIWIRLFDMSNNILQIDESNDSNKELYNKVFAFLGTMGSFVCNHKNFETTKKRVQLRANDENSTIIEYCNGCGFVK